MESLLAFIWAVCCYIIDLARWVVTILVTGAELICIIIAVAIGVHMINVFFIN